MDMVSKLAKFAPPIPDKLKIRDDNPITPIDVETVLTTPPEDE